MGAIETWECATLTVGRVDAGLGRCGQVVAAVRVVEPGPLRVDGTFLILNLGMFAFMSHGDAGEERVTYSLCVEAASGELYKILDLASDTSVLGCRRSSQSSLL